MRKLFAVGLVCVAGAAWAQPDELSMLKAQLKQASGVTIRLGGIDPVLSLRILTDAVIDLERRVKELESQPKEGKP